MKNKKAWIIGTAMGLSTLMLATVAFAGTGATTGYDALKALMINHRTVEAKNATLDLSVSVTEEGRSVLDLQTTMKTASEAQNMSGTVTLKGTGVDRAMTMYHTGTTAYMNVSGSDTWFRMDEAAEDMQARRGPHAGMRSGMNADMQDGMHGDMASNPDAAKFGEAFLDTAMGDLKNSVIMTESGSGRTFSLKIDQSNMPELMKAALALGASRQQSGPDDSTCFPEDKLAELGNPAAEAQLKALLPEMQALKAAINLKDNVTVHSIDFSFTVDADNQPVSGKTTVIVSGNAADGTAHTYTADMSMKLSAIGTTVPDTFNPEGKDVQVVQRPERDYAE